MPLEGQRILLVEDDVLIALDIEALICAHRGEVVLATKLTTALKLVETPGLTSSILDFRIGTDHALPVAERLFEYGVPFLFYTANSKPRIDEAWPNARVVEKPANPAESVHALASLVAPKQS